jgi:formylglycine-generating enzyme required for sulfatase activity
MARAASRRQEVKAWTMMGKGILGVLLFVAAASHRASAEAPSSGPGPAPTAAGASQSTPESMIRIPGGKFFLGRLPSKEPPCRPEGHDVTVSDFWIDRTEVTTGEYLACERAKACPRASRYFLECNARKRWKRRQHPINCVSAPARHRVAPCARASHAVESLPPGSDLPWM